jgi:hypothetical protein
MVPNSPAVEGVNVGGAVTPTISPGALAENLSRRARHHGASFASPGFTKFVNA